MPEITKDEILDRIIAKLKPQESAPNEKPKLIKMMEMMASQNPTQEPMQSAAPMPQSPMNLPVEKPLGQFQSTAPVPQTPAEKSVKLPRLPSNKSMLSQGFPYR
jgi:hypothetical protein